MTNRSRPSTAKQPVRVPPQPAEASAPVSATARNGLPPKPQHQQRNGESDLDDRESTIGKGFNNIRANHLRI